MGKKRRTILESYKHRAAIQVLMSWLEDDGYICESEKEFSCDGWTFYPDIAAYRDGFVQSFYEVTHQHPVDALKLGRMQYYCWNNDLEDILCHEVDAEWILRQVTKPDYIIKFTFDINPVTI